MNRTGDSAKEFGLYVSECCGVEMPFGEGDTFCRCPTCAAPCEWEMAEVVIPATELEEEEQITEIPFGDSSAMLASRTGTTSIQRRDSHENPATFRWPGR